MGGARFSGLLAIGASSKLPAVVRTYDCYSWKCLSCAIPCMLATYMYINASIHFPTGADVIASVRCRVVVLLCEDYGYGTVLELTALRLLSSFDSLKPLYFCSCITPTNSISFSLSLSSLHFCHRKICRNCTYFILDF